jgi:3-dehydrotetronate 4-kinase
MAIVDAISDEDLVRLGSALRGMPLVTAGSGVAIGLPQNFELAHRARASALPQRRGHRAIVSGSCSLATNAQVHDFVQRGGIAFALDPLQLAAGEKEAERAIDWALPRIAKGPLLIYSTAEPARVAEIQRKVGSADAGAIIERALAAIARALVDAGVTQLVVAGGETSGAVVQALGTTALRIGPQIDPGVPWTATEGGRPILLALKSGNFGTPDFFTKCFTLLDRDERSQTA